MKISIAQINPTVGYFSYNFALHQQEIEKAVSLKSDLIIFPELSLIGYPPKDLLEKPIFLEYYHRYEEKMRIFSARCPNIFILFGGITPASFSSKNGLYNSAILISNGSVIQRFHKTLLPAYDVFDEARYFCSGEKPGAFTLKGHKIGVSICEDIWNAEQFSPALYNEDPVQYLKEQEKIDILVNMSSSPYYAGKQQLRKSLTRFHQKRFNIPLIYVNQVGGNDELIFDGATLVVDKDGKIFHGRTFEEQHIQFTVKEDLSFTGYTQSDSPIHNLTENLYDALILGIRDYVRKCGFEKVIIGLSGGIDSAVTTALAADALGAERILTLTLPSAISSEGSVTDSRELAYRLGIKLETVPISDIYSSFLEALKPFFKDTSFDVAEENLQSRIRGDILMAMSNKFGYLLLTTGNKSELATGYCTLYGDMAGGLAVLADVYKTQVYELAHYINRHKEIIPETIINKTPTAELRPGQTDEESLCPYHLLDNILKQYIEEHKSYQKIVQSGLPEEIVKKIIILVDRNEYKRYQAPPCLKVTVKAFGFGRRMPIAKGFFL